MPVRATKRGAERTPLNGDCDVLDLRRELRRPRRRARAAPAAGARVLIVDRYEVGERQTSRVRGADRVARATSASSDSIRQTFRDLVVHTPSRHGPLAAAVDVLDVRLPRAVRAAARRRRDAEFETAKVEGRTGHTVHTDRGDLTAPLIVDALGWRRVLGAGRGDPAAGRAPVARPRGPPARPPATTSSCGSTPPTCARATRGASRPATSCASASARSTRATTSRSRRVRLAGDLGVPPERYQGNWIPHQMRDAGRGRDLLRRRQRRPLPARRPPRASAPRSTSAWPAGASCAPCVEGRQTREQALARYAAFCEEHRRAFDWLLRVQHLVGRVNPTPLMTPVAARDDLRALPRPGPSATTWTSRRRPFATPPAAPRWPPRR